MNRLVECPNCLGTGETVINKNQKLKFCKYCNGNGMVDSEIAESLVDESLEEFEYLTDARKFSTKF